MIADPRAALATAERRLINLHDLLPRASRVSAPIYRQEIAHLRDFIARLREELGHA